MRRRSTRRWLRHVTPLAAILAATAACGQLRRGPSTPPAVIYFTNESLDQASVFLVAPGLDFRRIGTVMPGRTDTLTVPADMANRGGPLNLVARLLARSEIPQTGPITLRPGEAYQVRLPPDARLLSFLPAGS